MSDKSALDIMVEGTISAARKAVAEAKFDTSTYGVITEKAGKQYKVAAFGGEYRITSDHDYSVGQKVVVTALQKNFRNIVVTEGNTSVELLNVKSVVGQLGNDLEKLSDKSDSEQKEAQSQINNTITTYYRHGSPSENTTSDPSANWTTDAQKKAHEGDLYQNIDDGKCYRWVNSGDGKYEWVEIADSGLINAISTAMYARDTADSKSRTFYLTGTGLTSMHHPTVPYGVGDIWVQGDTGEFFVCTTAKLDTEKYSVSDWVKATKYTDDTFAKEVKDDLDDLSATESNHYDTLIQKLADTNSNVSDNKSEIDTLKETVSGIQGNTGSFTEADYNLTKNQVETNKSDISTLKSDLSTAKTTETKHYTDLKRSISGTNENLTALKNDVSAITVDNFLTSLGLAINDNGELCYVEIS